MTGAAQTRPLDAPIQPHGANRRNGHGRAAVHPRTVLELTRLLAAATPGATAVDRLALDPATQAACDRWSARLAAQLTAPPARQPLAIAS